jgi:monoamine oxidase
MKAYRVISFCLLIQICLVSCTSKVERERALQQANETTAPVIIVGAGLTGLITAYELKKAGIRSIILEESNRIGGRINTIQYADHATAEAHMEEFFEHSPLIPILRELKLPLQENLIHSTVRIDNKVYVYKGTGKRDEYLSGIFSPDEQKAFLEWNNKTWEIYKELESTYFQGKPLTPNLKNLMRISFADYVRHYNLPRKVKEWIRVTLEPEIGVEWDRISALDGIDEMRIFLDRPEGFGEKIYHVKGGNKNLPMALMKKLPKGTIWPDCKVVEVSQDREKVLVTYMGPDGKEEAVTGRYAVVTVPLYAIEHIQFKPSLDEERRKAIATTGYGSYIKIHYRVKPEAKKTWAKYEDKDSGDKKVFTFLTDSPVGSIYNATRFEEKISPKDDFIITLLIHAHFTKKLLELSPKKIGQESAKNMNALFPGFSSYIESTDVYSYPAAIAYWPLKYKRSRFDDLANNLRKPFGRVFIGGDTTESSHSDGAAKAALRMSQELKEKLR